MGESRRRLAVFIHGLNGGGAQRRAVTLANVFGARGHGVDLVVLDAAGPLREEVSSPVRLVELRSRLAGWGGRRQQLRAAVPALASYLRRERPDLLLSAASHVNRIAALAHGLALSPTALVLRASNHFSASSTPIERSWPFSKGWWMRRLYPRADVIIAVSDSVAEDVAAVTGTPSERIVTVYNPIWRPALLEKLREPLEHPWFVPGAPPVVLGAGRLSRQKDFPCLIKAFAEVRKKRPVRLMILGDGKKTQPREQLVSLARALGVEGEVALPGAVSNPLPYMVGASVFALSSAWEGLPGVLIEALACGCPVVSTDCPGGSREILGDGRWGVLVPPADPGALAGAILQLFDVPPDRDALRARAAFFDVDRAVDGYLSVFESVLSPEAGNDRVGRA